MQTTQIMSALLKESGILMASLVNLLQKLGSATVLAVPMVRAFMSVLM